MIICQWVKQGAFHMPVLGLKSTETDHTEAIIAHTVFEPNTYFTALFYPNSTLLPIQILLYNKKYSLDNCFSCIVRVIT